MSGWTSGSWKPSAREEVYGEQVAAHQARPAGPGPVEVSLISDPAVPEGRYQLRQGLSRWAPGPAGSSRLRRSAFQQAAQGGFQQAPPRASYVPPEMQAAGPVSQVGVYPAGPVSQVGVFPAGAGLGAGRDPGWPFAHDGRTTSAPVSDTTATAGGGDLATVAEPMRPREA